MLNARSEQNLTRKHFWFLDVKEQSIHYAFSILSTETMELINYGDRDLKKNPKTRNDHKKMLVSISFDLCKHSDLFALHN